MEKIGYIGDKKSKVWRSPITQKVYNFLKRGSSVCPVCDVDDRDVEIALSYDNVFDRYSQIKGDEEYFKKLAKRRAAKKAERVKREKEEIEAQKSASVVEVENIVNELLEPLQTAISNLSHDLTAIQNDNKLIKAGIAELQKK